MLTSQFLLQDFVEEAKGTDIRCFVIGDKVVATMQRIGQDGDFVQIFTVVAQQKKLNLLKRKNPSLFVQLKP